MVGRACVGAVGLELQGAAPIAVARPGPGASRRITGVVAFDARIVGQCPQAQVDARGHTGRPVGIVLALEAVGRRRPYIL